MRGKRCGVGYLAAAPVLAGALLIWGGLTAAAAGGTGRAAAVAGAAGTAAPEGGMSAAERALRANNRGVAYMNRSAFADAAAQFRAALAADPDLVEARANLGIAQYAADHDAEAQATLRETLRRAPDDLYAHYVLGLIARNQGQYAAALPEFEFVVGRDPRDKSANYFTGYILLRLGRAREAIRYLDRALAQDPDDVSALFNLANAYRGLHDMPRALAYMRRFQQVRRASPLNTATSLVYGDEGKYAMAAATVPLELRPAPRPVAAHFADATAASGVSFRDGASDPAAALGPGACALDYDGDGRPDLFFVNSNGKPALYHNLGGGRFADVTAGSGLDVEMRGRGCAIGDYLNDGRPDILVTEAHRLLLFHNLGGGHFAEVAAKVGLTPAANAPRPDYLAPAWIDLDHDGYLDIVVTDAGAEGRVHVFRNLGTGRFQDVSAASRIGQRPGPTAGLVATDFDNNRDIDVVLTRARGTAAIFGNLRNGSFEELHPWSPATGESLRDARGVAALDFNHDGWIDLFLTRAAAPPVLLRATGTELFRVNPLPEGNAALTGGWGATALDYDNDGYVDLAFIADERDGRQALKLYRNLGDGAFQDASAATGLDRIPIRNARTILAVDWDGSGAPGLVLTQAGGPALLLRNEGGAANHSLLIAQRGLKDNKPGIGSKVTLNADGLTQTMEVEGGSGYLGQNPTTELFGLGAQTRADAVTILWPTGVLQSEFPPPSPGPGAARAEYNELNRKGGSCPLLFAWNGARFAFVDDVIGPGVIGEWAGPGQYDDPQPSECLRIPAAAARPRDGRYEFRFTDSMEEVVYLDRARLTVVDHPADVRVFSNDRWQTAGAAPAFRLWTAAQARPVAAATDGAGRNVLPYLGRFGRYVPIRARSAFPGYVGEHTLTLDLGDLRGAKTAQLLLHGWTDYYFPRTAWTAMHAGLPTLPPSLAVEEGSGRWRTVLPAMGAPAGLPRWMVVDLTPYLRGDGPGQGLARRRARVRIATNLAIYWDQILVSVNAPRPPLRVSHLEAAAAKLRRLGFPAETRESPEEYDYERVAQDVGFPAPAGNYTRYGAVGALLRAADNRYVIMAPGDEIALAFDASALPPLPAGWERTLFFCATGFTKGREFLDADPDSVGPLPLLNAAYPVPPGTRVSPELLQYRLEYNTRHLP